MPDLDDKNFFSNLYDSFKFDFSSLTWSSVFSFFAATGIIFGGVIPYIPQYLEIHKTQNADGFSTLVCFVLLVANTLRIVFWFGHRFEDALLAQSVIMIITMFAMVELCVRVKNRNVIGSSSIKNRMFFDLQLKYFWEWTDFVSYLECMATISLIAGIAMYFLIGVPIFVQGIGFVALLTEAALGLPQLYRNHVNKSTVGMNLYMVLLWLAGDVFKTIYYVVKDSPIQFWVCGFIQITIDILILMQGFFFRGQKKYKKIDKDYK